MENSVRNTDWFKKFVASDENLCPRLLRDCFQSVLFRRSLEGTAKQIKGIEESGYLYDEKAIEYAKPFLIPSTEKFPFGLERFSSFGPDIFLSDTTFLTIREESQNPGNLEICWISQDPAAIEAFTYLCSKLETNQRFEEIVSTLGDVFMLNARNGTISLDCLSDIGRPMIPTNYTMDVKEKIAIVKSELSSDQPMGRISILKGPSRSGKSNLVRDLIYSCKECVFIYAQASVLQALDNYHLVTSLIEFKSEQKRKIVLIIEDGDELLVSRMRDNIHLISRLLNTADGIYSDLLDVRFVITTNAKSDQIDTAIKERLSAMVHVNELPVQEANIALRAILNKEETDPNVFLKPTLLGHVYKKARELGWVPPPKEAILPKPEPKLLTALSLLGSSITKENPLPTGGKPMRAHRRKSFRVA